MDSGEEQRCERHPDGQYICYLPAPILKEVSQTITLFIKLFSGQEQFNSLFIDVCRHTDACSLMHKCVPQAEENLLHILLSLLSS